MLEGIQALLIDLDGGPIPAVGGVHPFLAHPGPIAFAHRGGAGEAPENTLEAFQIAVGLGYRYLETDVHRTRDGGLVAFHDERLDRVTDRGGLIAELSLAGVRAADAGFAFSPDGGRSFPFRGRGIGVPTLEEVLTRWPDVRVNVDPKWSSSEISGVFEGVITRAANSGGDAADLPAPGGLERGTAQGA